MDLLIQSVLTFQQSAYIRFLLLTFYKFIDSPLSLLFLCPPVENGGDRSSLGQATQANGKNSKSITNGQE